MGKKSMISVVCWVLFSTANAANFSFSGLFLADDDVRLFSFSVAESSTVMLRTYGYGGGVQADGMSVSAGGFDPMMTLCDSAGIVIGLNDDGASPPVFEDPLTDVAFDALLELDLGAGAYTLALTQTGNFATGRLADGFFYAGNPFYTANFDGNSSCSNGQFCSVNALDEPVNRSSAWALDIRNVANATVVPVPAAAWLFGSGLLGLFAAARRHGARATHQG